MVRIMLTGKSELNSAGNRPAAAKLFRLGVAAHYHTCRGPQIGSCRRLTDFSSARKRGKRARSVPALTTKLGQQGKMHHVTAPFSWTTSGNLFVEIITQNNVHIAPNRQSHPCWPWWHLVSSPGIQFWWFGAPLVGYFPLFPDIALSLVLHANCNSSPALETATPECEKWETSKANPVGYILFYRKINVIFEHRVSSHVLLHCHFSNSKIIKYGPPYWRMITLYLVVGIEKSPLVKIS